MIKTPFKKLLKQSKRIVALSGLTILGFIALGSMGGGDKSNTGAKKSILGDFTPIRTSAGFTLKAGPVYKGSMTFNQEKVANSISFNSLITYQKGNTTYILPYRSNVSLKNSNTNNLQMMNLKVNLHK